MKILKSGIDLLTQWFIHICILSQTSIDMMSEKVGVNLFRCSNKFGFYLLPEVPMKPS
jgi:hypothetical protein